MLTNWKARYDILKMGKYEARRPRNFIGLFGIEPGLMTKVGQRNGFRIFIDIRSGVDQSDQQK